MSQSGQTASSTSEHAGMEASTVTSCVPISAVIIARNEAANIERCLAALAWCGEIVVVDDHSTDATVVLARQLGARVLTHRFESFAAQRNWALLHGELIHDWVLMLDADEVATPEFAIAVQRAIDRAEESMVAFRTCRKTMLMGQWLQFSDGFPVWIMRVVRRGAVSFEDAGHGEVPVPHVAGQLGTIREPFLHFPFSKGLNDWLTRHLKYAEREARVELDMSRIGAWWEMFHWRRDSRRQALRRLSRRLPARSWLRFVYQYVCKLGFLDGAAGLLFCRLMAQYEALIVAKRQELKWRGHDNSL